MPWDEQQQINPRQGRGCFPGLAVKPTHPWGFEGASRTDKMPRFCVMSFRINYFVLKQTKFLILVQVLECDLRRI